MASNHAAIMRGLNQRLSQQAEHDNQQQQRQDDNNQGDDIYRSSSENQMELSNQMSVISLSISNDGYQEDLSIVDNNNTNNNLIKKTITNKSEGNSKMSRNQQHSSHRIMTSLARMKIVSDIDDCVDEDVRQAAILNKLEQKWFEISQNLNTVVDHLNESSIKVTNASVNCLESIRDSVFNTCDKVDEQIETLNQLISKCDELGTKLSAASTFYDEVKMLKKSVDTLENLYKTRPLKPTSK